jgi:hypothetical protein
MLPTFPAKIVGARRTSTARRLRIDPHCRTNVATFPPLLDDCECIIIVVVIVVVGGSHPEHAASQTEGIGAIARVGGAHGALAGGVRN